VQVCKVVSKPGVTEDDEGLKLLRQPGQDDPHARMLSPTFTRSKVSRRSLCTSWAISSDRTRVGRPGGCRSFTFTSMNRVGFWGGGIRLRCAGRACKAIVHVIPQVVEKWTRCCGEQAVRLVLRATATETRCARDKPRRPCPPPKMSSTNAASSGENGYTHRYLAMRLEHQL
jgi:hypothetical protein